MTVFCLDLGLMASTRRAAAGCLVAWLILSSHSHLKSQSGDQNQADPMLKMIPLGAVNRNLHIPTFARDGRKASDLHADTAVRIDGESLLAHKVDVFWHGQQPSQDMKIHLPSAFYNMMTQMVRTDERSEVRRSDLKTSGDSLVFDAKSSTGRLVGRVRTLLFSSANQKVTGP